MGIIINDPVETKFSSEPVRGLYYRLKRGHCIQIIKRADDYFATAQFEGYLSKSNSDKAAIDIKEVSTEVSAVNLDIVAQLLYVDLKDLYFADMDITDDTPEDQPPA